MTVLLLNFWEISRLLSKEAALVYFPTKQIKGSPSPTLQNWLSFICLLMLILTVVRWNLKAIYIFPWQQSSLYLFIINAFSHKTINFISSLSIIFFYFFLNFIIVQKGKYQVNRSSHFNISWQITILILCIIFV